MAKRHHCSKCNDITGRHKFYDDDANLVTHDNDGLCMECHWEAMTSRKFAALTDGCLVFDECSPNTDALIYVGTCTSGKCIEVMDCKGRIKCRRVTDMAITDSEVAAYKKLIAKQSS